MKKLALVVCMLIASAVALYAEEGNESRRFEVSGTAYAPIGESSEFLGEVTFASDLSDLVGLSVDGLVSHLSDDDPTTFMLSRRWPTGSISFLRWVWVCTVATGGPTTTLFDSVETWRSPCAMR